MCGFSPGCASVQQKGLHGLPAPPPFLQASQEPLPEKNAITSDTLDSIQIQTWMKIQLALALMPLSTFSVNLVQYLTCLSCLRSFYRTIGPIGEMKASRHTRHAGWSLMGPCWSLIGRIYSTNNTLLPKSSDFSSTPYPASAAARFAFSRSSIRSRASLQGYQWKEVDG